MDGVYGAGSGSKVTNSSTQSKIQKIMSIHFLAPMAEEGGASFPVSGAYALNRYIAPNFDEHGTTCQVSMEEPVWHATGPVAFLDTLPAATHNPKAGLESGTQPFGRRTTPNVICKTQRDPRLTYSEEQKFWIMYARIIEQRTWPDIKKGFSRLFGVRSRGVSTNG